MKTPAAALPRFLTSSILLLALLMMGVLITSASSASADKAGLSSIPPYHRLLNKLTITTTATRTTSEGGRSTLLFQQTYETEIKLSSTRFQKVGRHHGLMRKGSPAAMLDRDLEGYPILMPRLALLPPNHVLQMPKMHPSLLLPAAENSDFLPSYPNSNTIPPLMRGIRPSAEKKLSPKTCPLPRHNAHIPPRSGVDADAKPPPTNPPPPPSN